MIDGAIIEDSSIENNYAILEALNHIRYWRNLRSKKAFVWDEFKEIVGALKLGKTFADAIKTAVPNIL